MAVRKGAYLPYILEEKCRRKFNNQSNILDPYYMYQWPVAYIKISIL